MYPLWYWLMVNMWPPRIGWDFVPSFLAPLNIYPTTSNTDTPFYIMKASRSDRMHQGKTNQKRDDSQPERVCVLSETGTSPQLTIHTAQRCVQHCTECTALEVFTVQP